MNRHVLIIDRDLVAAHVTAASVKRVMPQTTQAIAADVEAGMEQVRQRCPDLLIIDPPWQSEAVVRLIQTVKAQSPTSQVMVLTSSPSPTLRRTMRELGVDVYVQKTAPIAPVMEAFEAIGSLMQRL